MSELLRDMKDLVETKGWKQFCLLVQQQQDARVAQSIMTPIKNLEDAFAREALNASIRRAQELVGLPDAVIADLTEEKKDE